MYPNAIEVFNRLRRAEDAPAALTHLAIAYAAAGQKAEGRRLLSEATKLHQGYIPPYWVGVAYRRRPALS
jgi:Flp pilus assembly protein TadD